MATKPGSGKSPGRTRRKSSEAANSLELKQNPGEGRKAFGRSIADFGRLSTAERKLLEACRIGDVARIGDTLPERPSSSNKIRGELLRFLLLGGDEPNPVYENAIVIKGAYISGLIDIAGCSVRVPLTLLNCMILNTIRAVDAFTMSIQLRGCNLNGLDADRITISGGLFLNEGSESRSGLSIQRASISGPLDLASAKIEGTNPDQCALNADGIYVHGSVHLSYGFTAKGLVALNNAEVDGNLMCSGGLCDGQDGHALKLNRISVRGNAIFCDGFVSRGRVEMQGAHVRGSLDCNNCSFLNRDGDDIAIHANGMRVESGFFWKNIRALRGEINFNAVTVGSLNDDLDSWLGFKDVASFALNGLRYERIGSGSVTDARDRIEWLKLPRPQRHTDLFWPHPWDQLIKVLRLMGHFEDAKVVAIAKQKRLRQLRLIGNRRPNKNYKGFRLVLDAIWAKFSRGTARVFHAGYGILAGYGYRPFRTVLCLLGVCLATSLLYYDAARHGVFGPSDAVIQVDRETRVCGDNAEPEKQHWTSCSALPPEYVRLQPFVYSLDVILPLVDLGQETEWQPIVRSATGTVSVYGHIVRIMIWLEIVFGWMASLMLVAALGKMVERD